MPFPGCFRSGERHKVFRGMAKREHTCMAWFSGCKGLHPPLIHGQCRAGSWLCGLPRYTDGHRTLEARTTNLQDKVFADQSYLSKEAGGEPMAAEPFD